MKIIKIKSLHRTLRVVAVVASLSAIATAPVFADLPTIGGIRGSMGDMLKNYAATGSIGAPGARPPTLEESFGVYGSGGSTGGGSSGGSGNNSASTSGNLTWAQALRSVYKAEAATSSAASTANNQKINKNAMTDPLCKQLFESKEKSEKDFVKNKLPPDPSKVIENSTCFIDVMDIAIPTTGSGFLDTVVGAITPFLKSSACKKQAEWWNDAKSKMTSGQFGALDSQFNSAINAVNAVNQVQGGSAQTGGVQSYASLLNGTSTRPNSSYSGTPGTTDGAYNAMNAQQQVIGDRSGNTDASADSGTPQSKLTAGVASLRNLLGLP